MGVYNPKMEMPRNCTECLEFGDYCKHYWDEYCIHETRPMDCPLIEIPDELVEAWHDYIKKAEMIARVKAVNVPKGE